MGRGYTFSGCVWGVVAKALLWVSAYAGMTVRPFERLRGERTTCVHLPSTPLRGEDGGGTPGWWKRMLLRSPSPESSPTAGRGYPLIERVGGFGCSVFPLGPTFVGMTVRPSTG